MNGVMKMVIKARIHKVNGLWQVKIYSPSWDANLKAANLCLKLNGGVY
jgi:hypothetical protein